MTDEIKAYLRDWAEKAHRDVWRGSNKHGILKLLEGSSVLREAEYRKKSDGSIHWKLRWEFGARKGTLKYITRGSTTAP